MLQFRATTSTVKMSVHMSLRRGLRFRVRHLRPKWPQTGALLKGITGLLLGNLIQDTKLWVHSKSAISSLL